jgi:phosphate transport system permease protein
MSSPHKPARPSTSLGDWLFRWICRSAGIFVILIILTLLGLLIYQAVPVLQNLGKFQVFTSSNWNPTPGDGEPVFGSLLFIYGTVATSIIAMLIAVPLGVGSAAFLSEIAPAWMRRICSFMIELLAAIPSVVYGFWGIFFVGPAVAWFFNLLGVSSTTSGKGILASGLILAIMVVPYITAISYDVCRAVPRTQREGSLSLGATRWQMIWTVVLPYARPGIIAACFLALGRALGETMAVTMMIGNVRYLNFSPFAAGDSIASIIANQLNEASGDARAALIMLGLILFCITAITNVGARFLIARAARPRVRAHGFYMVDLDLNEPAPPPDPVDHEKARRRSQRQDRIMTWVLGGCQLCTVVPLFLILGYITVKGVVGLDLNLFTEAPRTSGGGLGNAMLGSLMMVGTASLFAIPLAILAAVYLAEFRNDRLTGPVRFVTELLAGVPSIIIGVFGAALLVHPRSSGWAGVFALGIMMLPVLIRTSEEAMRLVPNALREASYALGATQWQTVMRVILPAAAPAIITGVLLAMSRIAGETAPLLLTAGNSQFWPQSLSEPTPYLTYFIYNYAKSGEAELERQAWAASFVLLVFIMTLNIGVRLIAGKRQIMATSAG